MKVTHVNTYCTGGAAKACLRTVHALNKTGVDSKMLVLYKTNKENDVIDFRNEYSLIKNYQLKVNNKLFVLKHEGQFGNKEELFSSYDSPWDVASHNLIRSCDVVNLHWVRGFIDFPSFLNSIKKKIVITLHDYFPFSGGFHYPNPLFEKEPYKTAAFNNKKLILSYYKNSNIHFVGPSQYIINQLKKTEGFGEFKTSIIKNPVDSSIFYLKDKLVIRKKLGYASEDKVLLIVNEKEGYKRKGFQLFNKMLPELIKQGYKILFVGEKTNSINDLAVNQIGYVYSDPELNNLYNAADLLLCTSLDDNLPNVISESHCAGTPVIAFNTGGIGEMIQDNENGYLVEKFNTELYLKKIEELVNRGFDRKMISETAHDVYSETNAAEKYANIYKNT